MRPPKPSDFYKVTTYQGTPGSQTQWVIALKTHGWWRRRQKWWEETVEQVVGGKVYDDEYEAQRECAALNEELRAK